MERPTSDELPEISREECQLLGLPSRHEEPMFRCERIGNEWQLIAETQSARRITRTLLTLAVAPMICLAIARTFFPKNVSGPLALMGYLLFGGATVATLWRHSSATRRWRRQDPLITFDDTTGQITFLARSQELPRAELHCLLLLSLPTPQGTATELQLLRKTAHDAQRYLLLRTMLEGTFPLDGFLRPFAARTGIPVVKAWQRVGVNDDRLVFQRL